MLNREKSGPGCRGVLLGALAVLGLSGCLDDQATTATAGLAPESSASTGTGAINQAPTIGGSPQTWAQIGQFYEFKPTAGDADGDTLAFAISNKPDWASFDTTSGRLSGTPTAGDAGLHANIVISVSDGPAVRGLTAFAIDVRQMSTGSATLSWLPPTEQSDGSPLVDLAGYYVYYSTRGDASGGQKIRISNASVSRYVVENLGPATWYFAVKAYTMAGVESDLSAVVTKVIL